MVISLARLLIGAGQNNFADQFLDGPTLFDELPGQEVEQLGVRGWFAAQSEVAGRSYQTRAKKAVPDPVHDNPCRQWIFGGSDGLGQFQPAFSGAECSAIRTGQHLQEPERYRFPLELWISMNEDMGLEIRRGVRLAPDSTRPESFHRRMTQSR
jgi:hypothetical protein